MIKKTTTVLVLLVLLQLTTGQPTVCTMDTKLCPDGTYVGRDFNNNCQFFPCSNGSAATNSGLPITDTAVPATSTGAPSTDTGMPPFNSTETLNNTGSEFNSTETFNNTGSEFNNTGSEFNNTETEFNSTGPINTQPSPNQLPGSQLNSSCIYGTLLFNGQCACWSGAFGSNCEMGDSVTCQKIISNPWSNVNSSSNLLSNSYQNLDSQDSSRDFCMNINNHPSCPSYSSWGVVQPLSTMNPPRLDSATFHLNTFNILISQPMVNGRADGAVFLNDINSFQSSPFCVYPLSQYIFKQVDGCRDVWNFSLPWDQAINCGWKVVNEEGYRTYRGQVIVHNHEWLENIKEFRFVQSVLRLRVRFQIYVKINLGSAVYSAPNLQSAITRQIISVNLGDSATIELTTLLNYPYCLSNGDLILTPQGKVENSTFNQLDVYKNNNGCLQRWSATLFLSNGTCTLDGAYRMNFTEICSDSSIKCPLSNTPVSIDFSLVSENFCAEITIDIGLYGTIKIYGDAGFTSRRGAFISGTINYFLLELNSDSNASPYNPSNAAYLLSKTILQTVTIRMGEDCIIRLFENGTVADNDYGSGITEISRPEGNIIAFSFNFTDSLMDQLNCSSSNVTLGADVQVNYATTTGGSSTKRWMLAAQSGQEKTTLSTTAPIDNGNNNAQESSNNNNFANMMFVSLGVVLFAILF